MTIVLIIIALTAIAAVVWLALANSRLRREAEQARTNAARLEERIEARIRADEQQSQILTLFQREREQFAAQFRAATTEMVDTKSRSMTAATGESVKAMLEPLGEKIELFKARIEQESRQRFALENEVKRLAELNLRMSQEANNLTLALKGNSKSQGDWGEMILETLLENSGLKRGIHFRVQEVIRDAEGNILRPDVVLMLPDEKEIIIDSKVSINAYVNYCHSGDEAQLAAHVAAVRSHIGELGRKSYHKLVASPDFVIMFVPNEPAFLAALQGDDNLYRDAFERGVILSSPTNLFAILRIVDDLWRRDSQSRNFIEIARQAGDMYDKFAGFYDTLTEVGRAIKKCEDNYERAVNQLSTGKGNLMNRAESLRKLGIKTTKSLPAADDDAIE